MLHNIILLTIKSAEILRSSYVIKLDMSTLVTVHHVCPILSSYRGYKPDI